MKDKFKMKNRTRNGALAMAVMVGLLCSAQASAQLAVIDVDNLIANEANLEVNEANLEVNTANMVANTANAAANVGNLAINTATLAEVILLKKSLSEGGEGTMLNYTANIDNSTTNVSEKTELNYEIDQNFTWIIGGGDDGGGDVIIPVPDGARKHLTMLEGEGDAYASNFQDYDNYKGKVADKTNLSTSGVAGSLHQKQANDAVVKTLSSQNERLSGEAEAITTMVKNGTAAQGNNRQLQYANALAGAQADQLLQMRALMIASQNAQTAAGQAAADRESRELAGANSLRDTTSNK